MEENDRRDLESLFAQVKDPLLGAKQAASITGYHHSGNLWRPLRSRRMQVDTISD
jgi:hypothetical protein